MNKHLTIFLLRALVNLQKEQMICVMKLVNKKYPRLFTKKNMNYEISKINIETTSLSSKRKDKIQNLIKKRLDTRKKMNTGQYSLPKRTLPIEDLRCIARVWGNAYMNKINRKKIYGARCCNEIKHGKSSKYCGIHMKSNKHGDFNKMPPDDVIKEYEKYAKKLM